MAIRNTGSSAARSVVATVRLPPGVTVRAGGSSSPNDWHCTGSGQVATCSVASLPAGTAGTARVKVSVARGALAGAVTGQVVGAGGLGVTIPTAVLPVAPK